MLADQSWLVGGSALVLSITLCSKILTAGHRPVQVYESHTTMQRHAGSRRSPYTPSMIQSGTMASKYLQTAD